MGDMKPIRAIIRPSERLLIMREMAAMGCTVNWNTVTGDMTITPPATQGGKPDAFDLVDFSR